LLNRVKLCAGFPDWRCSCFISRENLSLGHKTELKTREQLSPDVSHPIKVKAEGETHLTSRFD
jgi:hypothetical protein